MYVAAVGLWLQCHRLDCAGGRPEQLEEALASQESDRFALGVMVYNFATGRNFGEERDEWLAALPGGCAASCHEIAYTMHMIAADPGRFCYRSLRHLTRFVEACCNWFALAMYNSSSLRA